MGLFFWNSYLLLMIPQLQLHLLWIWQRSSVYFHDLLIITGPVCHFGDYSGFFSPSVTLGGILVLEQQTIYIRGMPTLPHKGRQSPWVSPQRCSISILFTSVLFISYNCHYSTEAHCPIPPGKSNHIRIAPWMLRPQLDPSLLHGSHLAKKQATPPLRFLFVLFVPVQASIVTFFFWGDLNKYLSSPQIHH